MHVMNTGQTSARYDYLHIHQNALATKFAGKIGLIMINNYKINLYYQIILSVKKAKFKTTSRHFMYENLCEMYLFKMGVFCSTTKFSKCSRIMSLSWREKIFIFTNNS